MDMKFTSNLRSKLSTILEGNSLRARAARGGTWLGSASAAEQMARFGRNMLLTRLLAPSAFGTMAIVLSCSSLITSMSDVGLWPAVVQNPRGGEEEYLNAAWWLGMARSISIYIIVLIMAPWVGRFYGSAEISGLLRLTLLSILLDGLLSPKTKLAQKGMKFRQYALITNGGAIAGVFLTCLLSYLLRNVWALAIGYCSEFVFRCIASYLFYPGLPSFKWKRQAFDELLRFSKGMFGLSFLNFVFARTDIFVVGKLFGPAVLGIYALAVNLIQTPSEFLISTLSSTFLPAFSLVQSEKERGPRILMETSSWAILLGLPALVMIALAAPSILHLAYGAQYSAAANVLRFAEIGVFLNVLNSLITTSFFGMGRPELHRRAVAASAITMLIACYPACKAFGVIGGQIATVLAIAVSYFLQIARTRELNGTRTLQYVKALFPATAVSAGALALVVGARFMGIVSSPLANICASLSGCAIAFLTYILIFPRLKTFIWG